MRPLLPAQQAGESSGAVPNHRRAPDAGPTHTITCTPTPQLRERGHPQNGGGHVFVAEETTTHMRILAGKGAVFAAIVLGLLTSFLAWRYVNQAQPAQAAIDTTPVVVATIPIDARTVITPQMVRVQQMPTSAVHPESMQSIDQV